MFNGFSGLVSFFLHCMFLTPLSFLIFYDSISFPCILFDRQITITIRFTDTYINFSHRRPSVPSASKDYGPSTSSLQLCLQAVSIPFIFFSFLCTTTNISIILLPPTCYKPGNILLPCFLRHHFFHTSGYRQETTKYTWRNSVKTCTYMVRSLFVTNCPLDWEELVDIYPLLSDAGLCATPPGCTENEILLMVSMSLSTSCHERMHYTVLNAEESDLTGNAIKSAKLMESGTLWTEFSWAFGCSPASVPIWDMQINRLGGKNANLKLRKKYHNSTPNL